MCLSAIGSSQAINYHNGVIVLVNHSKYTIEGDIHVGLHHDKVTV